MSDNQVPPPPGYYDDGTGQQKYWDGQQWAAAAPSDGRTATSLAQPSAGPKSTPKRTNGLGVAALVLGLVALVFAWIPIANYFGMFIGLVGLVLGIVGLLIKNRSKGLTIAGAAISALALILAIIMAVVYATAFAAAVKSVQDEGSRIQSSSAPSAGSSAPSTPGHTIEYQVTSDAPTANNITYYTFSNGQGGSEQANGAPVPWSKQFTVKGGGLFDFNSLNITAMATADATTITCTITEDGVVKSTQTSTGAYAMVTCNASGS